MVTKIKKSFYTQRCPCQSSEGVQIGAKENKTTRKQGKINKIHKNKANQRKRRKKRSKEKNNLLVPLPPKKYPTTYHLRSFIFYIFIFDFMPISRKK